VLDENGDGYISRDELSSNSVLGQVTDKELKELIDFFDSNSDGNLDFEEFMNMITDNEGFTASPQVSPRVLPSEKTIKTTPSKDDLSSMSGGTVTNPTVASSNASTPDRGRRLLKWGIRRK